MATYVAGMGSGFTLELNTALTGQSTPGNTSTLAWSLVMRSPSSGGAQSNYQNGWSVNINGQQFSGQTTYNLYNGAALVLGQGSVVIPHNSDGTKTAAVWGSFDNVAWSSGNPNDTTVSANETLPTIARNSTVSITPASGYIDGGTTMTVGVTPANSSYRHDVEVFFGNEYTSAQMAVGVTSVNIPIPVSWAAQIPNSLSGGMRIKVSTISGNSVLGTQDIWRYFGVPPSVVPTLSSLSIAEAVPGVATVLGAGNYLQNVSKLTLGINGAAGAQGSSITGRKVELAPGTANAQSVALPTSSGTAVSPAVRASGSVQVKGTVTDSRGRQAAISQNVNVLAYNSPNVSSVSVQRASSTSGTPSDGGQYIRVNINANVQSLVVGGSEKNALQIVIFTRLRGTTTWTERLSFLHTSLGFNSFRTLSQTFAVESAHEVRVEIRDRFSTSAVERTVSMAAIHQHWSQTGIGVGKYHENGMLDVAGQVFHGAGNPVPWATAAGEYFHGANVNNGAGVTLAMTFPANRFTQAPNVQALPNTSRLTLSSNAVTTSGCNIRADNWTPGVAGGSSSAPIIIQWLAVQMLSGSRSG